MPEATPQLVKPVIEKPIDVDARLNQIRQSVGTSADQAMGNRGIPHNTAPPIEMGIPVQVSVDGSTHKTVEDKKGSLDVPDTHKSDPNVENIRHFVDFTGGESGAPPRTGEAGEVIDLQKAKAAKAQEQGNKGVNQPVGVIQRIGNWFMKDEKAA